jgi:drug/metabolite transporter (DMT)-like permease
MLSWVCYVIRHEHPICKRTHYVTILMSQTTHQQSSTSLDTHKAAEPSSRYAFYLLASVIFLWGINFPLMKIALEEIDPWTFRTLCLTAAGSGFFALAKMGGLPLSIPRQERKPIVLAALLNVTGWSLCSAYGLVHLQAGRAAVIGSTMPLWATIMARFVLKEQLTYEHLAGLGLGLVGLTILIWPDIRAIGEAPFHAAFMLGAAISWAAGTITMKHFQWTAPIIVLTGWQFILGAIPLVTGTLLFSPAITLSQISFKVIFCLAYTIIAGIIFCYWAWFKAVSLLPTSVVSISTLPIPVLGVFSSALILAERIGLREFVALALVLVGLFIVLIRPYGVESNR